MRPDAITGVSGGVRQFLPPSALPSSGAGLSTTRREVVTPDGQHFLVESVRDANGLPREVRVTRDGVQVAVLSNEWLAMAGGFTLTQQRFVRFAAGGASETFDSRAHGGVSSLIVDPISIDKPIGLTIHRTRTPSALDDAGWYYGGPCDAQERAVESALEDWLVSVVGMGAVTASGNIWAAMSAWAYQLKKYRDVTRAEAALDQCVADAGKPPEW